MSKKFVIFKKNGKVDIEIKDGKYHLVADITIENGKIKFIDSGIWTKLIKEVNK